MESTIILKRKWLLQAQMAICLDRPVVQVGVTMDRLGLRVGGKKEKRPSQMLLDNNLAKVQVEEINGNDIACNYWSQKVLKELAKHYKLKKVDLLENWINKYMIQDCLADKAYAIAALKEYVKAYPVLFTRLKQHPTGPVHVPGASVPIPNMRGVYSKMDLLLINLEKELFLELDSAFHVAGKVTKKAVML